MITHSGVGPARPIHFGTRDQNKQLPEVQMPKQTFIGYQPVGSDKPAIPPGNEDGSPSSKNTNNPSPKEVQSRIEAARALLGLGTVGTGSVIGVAHELYTLKPDDNPYIETSKGLFGGGSVGLGFTLFLALSIKALRKIFSQGDQF